MTIKLGVVMDPIDRIHFKKDSTLAMLWAARDRGWTISYMTCADLYLANGEPFATAREIQVFDNPDDFFSLGAPADIPLSGLDAILMRKDPPFDNEFLYATHLLEAAETRGTLVVNRPQSLRDCNEKLFATQFPQCIPPQVVTRNAAKLREFHREHGDIILKPLDGMGGSSIFRVGPNDPNLGVIIETLTRHGEETVMAQRYLPAISEGDKRILLIDGEAVPYCLARIPAKGETRGNLAAGGTGRAQPLSERDQWIANQVAPVVREKGLLFVGLDVIGDYLTEINVTSPTCIREIDRAFDTRIAERLMDAVAARLPDNARNQRDSV